jgi:methylisocitrate lyase
MLNVKTLAAEKRQRLRHDLQSGRLLRFPGAMSPLVAMLIEEQGFDGVYISGAVLAADLGLPDIGLTTATEITQRSYQIARATNLPALTDIDTGFGEPMNTFRTVQELEDLGLAGCHLEDQLLPKRCGHLDHKSLVDEATMVRRIQAAVAARRDPNFLIIARTDARSVEGLDQAVQRARAYEGAGADMVFPEALTHEQEFAAVRQALKIPLLANMTEFGKSPLLDVQTLESLGYNLVIYPVTGLRLAMHNIEEGFVKLRDAGSQKDLLRAMQSRGRLYKLLGYEAYDIFDTTICNFKLK